MHTSLLTYDTRHLIMLVRQGDIVLLPEFQRGSVWNLAMKQRLIDTILRGWSIPPVYFVETPHGHSEVLDGQQRLLTLVEFANDGFPVDGTLGPPSGTLDSLHGRRYSELPELDRLRFDRFTVAVLRITDYEPAESLELFFRLNQSVSPLTAAEQRNALYGPAREQVRHLVELAISLGISEHTIGFSNSRMAYDDVVSRFCLSLERRSIAEKVTAEDLANRYRSSQPFSHETVEACSAAVRLLAAAVTFAESRTPLNKATLLSWLWFVSRFSEDAANGDSPLSLAAFISDVEGARRSAARGRLTHLELRPFQEDPRNTTELARLYNDRASSRAADASSVILRDMVLCMLSSVHTSHLIHDLHESGLLNSIGLLWKAISQHGVSADTLLASAFELNWGRDQ